MISRKEAEKLAAKLDATPEPGGKHMKVHVYVDGKRVKTFGFSHDAKKPNPHIAGSLGISLRDTQALARCQKSEEWYFEHFR